MVGLALPLIRTFLYSRQFGHFDAIHQYAHLEALSLLRPVFMHSSSAAVWVGWVVSTSGRAPRSFATFDGEFLTAFLEVVVATGWEISDRFCCLNAGSVGASALAEFISLMLGKLVAPI